MQRRRKRNSKQNEERWLITYSDLITLLLIFFIIMYAMSSISQAKLQTLSQSLQAALKQSDKIPLEHMGSTSLISAANAQNKGNKAPVADNKENQSLDNLYQTVQQYIQQHHLQGNVSIVNEQRGVQITLKDVVLFDTGEATIKPGAQKLLQGLIPFFTKLPNPIVIEGYTDNQPITTSQFPSNWELSSARAIGVVRFIASNGVAPDRLSGVGYGQYHNLKPNDNAADRQANRRVNIVILRQGLNPGTFAASNSQNSTSGSQDGTSGSQFGTADGLSQRNSTSAN
jgi:chemotaxis protein MotB